MSFLNPFYLFVVIFFFILKYPFIFFKIFKINKKLKNNTPTLDCSNEYNRIGVASFKASPKNIKIISQWNNRVNFFYKICKFLPFSKLFFDKKYYIYTNTNYLRWKILFPELKKIISDEMDDTLNSILGENYEITSVLWQRNFHIPAKIKDEAFSNFWHFDFRRNKKKWARVMIYLNDQGNAESLHWFKKADSLMAIKNKDYGRYSPENLPKYLNNLHKTSPGPLGTMNLVNTADILHRAGMPLPGKFRDVVFVILQSKNTEWEDNFNFINKPAHVMSNS